jgi:hypothetical protein
VLSPPLSSSLSLRNDTSSTVPLQYTVLLVASKRTPTFVLGVHCEGTVWPALVVLAPTHGTLLTGCLWVVEGGEEPPCSEAGISDDDDDDDDDGAVGGGYDDRDRE